MLVNNISLYFLLPLKKGWQIDFFIKFDLIFVSLIQNIFFIYPFTLWRKNDIHSIFSYEFQIFIIHICTCRLFSSYFVRVMSYPRCPFPIVFPLTFCLIVPLSLASSPDLSPSVACRSDWIELYHWPSCIRNTFVFGLKAFAIVVAL